MQTQSNGSQSKALATVEGFGTLERQQIVETAAIAFAAQAQAAVQARYVMAMKNPRDIDVYRAAILKECKRPGFAAVAMYSKPQGGTNIEGLSVRFVEAALRCFRNTYNPTEVIFDDEEKRIIRQTVSDLEANVTYPKDITVMKRVERRKPRDGQRVLDKRTNSSGQIVYVVEASDDEIQVKEAALASKALRTNGLRVLPGDITDECRALIKKVLSDENAKDPELARKRVSDSYAFYNVGPEQLGKYLGKPLAQATPDELRDLVATYNAIVDKETTWQDVLEARLGERAPESAAPGASPPVSKAESIKDRVRAQQAQPFHLAVPVEPAVDVLAESRANNPPASSEPSDTQTSPESQTGVQTGNSAGEPTTKPTSEEPDQKTAVVMMKEQFRDALQAFVEMIGDRKLAETLCREDQLTLMGANTVKSMGTRLAQLTQLTERERAKRVERAPPTPGSGSTILRWT